MAWRILIIALSVGVFGCRSEQVPLPQDEPVHTSKEAAKAATELPARASSTISPSLRLGVPPFATTRQPITRSCPNPFESSCVDDYLSLAALLRPEVDDWDALDKTTLDDLRALREGGDSVAKMTPWAEDWVDAPHFRAQTQLSAELARRLGINALLKGTEVLVQLESSSRGVARAGSLERPFQEFDLLLKHPGLGSFDAVLRIPTSEGPSPIILVLPGHISGNGFVDETWNRLAGQRMVTEGFGLLIARPRGADAEAVETAASVRLLAAGHSLVGTHIAEAWLLAEALRYLRQEGLLADGKTGVLGHSSGALTGNALCHLAAAVQESPVTACVNDLYSDYFKLLCSGERCWVLDETDPRLRGLRHPLSGPADMPTLSPRPPYGLVAEDGSDLEVKRVLDFFESELR